MDDFTKIEVNKIFPDPVLNQEGVQIELWYDKLTCVDSDAGAQKRSIESLK